MNCIPRSLKKILSLIIIIVILISSCPCTESNIKAKDNEDTEKNWGEVYIDYLQKYYKGYAESFGDGPRINYKRRFQLIYLDDNDIPEILYSYVNGDPGNIGIIFQKDGKADYYSFFRYSFDYIERTGVIVIAESFMDGPETLYYKYENGVVYSEEQYGSKLDNDYGQHKYISMDELNLITYDELIVEIQALSMGYSDIDWIKAYQDFLGNQKYRKMGKAYSDDAITGWFLDMEQDGIPELILGNPYNPLNVYTYDNGEIIYVSEYNRDNYTDYRDLDRRYSDGKGIVELYSELSAFEVFLNDGMTNPAYEVDELVGLIGSVNSTYNYKDKDSIDRLLNSFFSGFRYNLKKYPGDMRSLYSGYSEDFVSDPKERYPWGYTRQEGEGCEWILKNIYNVPDEYINNAHNNKTDYCYYQDGYYYGNMFDGEGFYTYIEDIENLGGVYHICFGMAVDSDIPSMADYWKGYALAARKVIDGVGYWSIYRVDNTSLYDEAGLIDVGFQISDKYKPYKIIALKSKSNGCYVTCDIGSRNEDGKYEHYGTPELHMDATEIGAYEMFELVKCSNGSYALRSVMNRKFLTNDIKFDAGRHSYVYDDFIKKESELIIDLNSKYTTIKFKKSNDVLCYGVSSFKTLLEPDSDSSKAEEFEIIVLKEDKYEAWEENILSSGEWFNLDGEQGGYWNIQNEIINEESTFGWLFF